MHKIRKGDQVIVIAGRTRASAATSLRVVDTEHVVVDGINRVKKHQRPNPMKGADRAASSAKDMPIHVSNVAVYNPATKRPDRVGFRTLEDGRKVRFFKSNGEVIDA